MAKNARRALLFLLLVALFALGGMGAALLVAPDPSAAQGGGSGGPVRFSCDRPPETIARGDKTWSLVREIMEGSGCDPERGECWTDWIVSSNPRGWYEDASARTYRRSGDGDSSPPTLEGYFPTQVQDPRARCDVDCDGEAELAAGTWYVNLAARPSMSGFKLEDGIWNIRCVWRLDDSMYYWFFGEDDRCPRCVCWPITPTAAPDKTPAPPYTACAATPLSAPTMRPPPEITTLPYPPQASVTPWADVRSPREAAGVWHRTGQDFYWLWQTPLIARLGADASVSPTGGCDRAEAEVVMTYLYKINGQRVCPSPFDKERTPPNPTHVLYPPEGDEACVWRSLDQSVGLLWSRLPMQPSRPASWNNFGVTPYTQDWIVLTYKAWLWVTYWCNGLPETVPQFQDLELRVGLVKPVQPLRPARGP